MVEIFKALGDYNRLRIINLLIQSELCVSEIETVLKLSQSNVSRHLAKLKTSGLIDSYKEAQWIHYKISSLIKNNQRDLFTYISSNLKEDQFQTDLKVLNNYKSCELTCTDIRENQDMVNRKIFKGL